MQIRKLSADLLEDWLYFFDHVAFCDNGEWEGCYCMCYHWNETLNRHKNWNCSKADAPYNRQCAIDFILKGKIKGYLAYENEKVIGWCNTNDKQAYDNVNFQLPFDDFDKKYRVKCIVCFCISPYARGKGVATALLEKVYADAAAEGYDFMEAYPFNNDDNNAYHGPQSMYVKHGFKKYKHFDEVTIFRKSL